MIIVQRLDIERESFLRMRAREQDATRTLEGIRRRTESREALYRALRDHPFLIETALRFAMQGLEELQAYPHRDMSPHLNRAVLRELRRIYRRYERSEKTVGPERS